MAPNKGRHICMNGG